LGEREREGRQETERERKEERSFEGRWMRTTGVRDTGVNEREREVM
jgi:hypothetical protein